MTGATAARSFGHDEVVDARLRPVVAQTLVVLHIEHADDLAVAFGDDRDVLDPADVPGELQAVGRVAGGALGHAPPELDQQVGHGAPVLGERQTDGRPGALRHGARV